MSTLQVENDDDIILVEFRDESGLSSVSIDPEELIRKSQVAIERSMKTMQSMGKKAIKTIQSIPVSERPSTFQFQFGINLNGEAGALIAKVGAEASIIVTMTWEHKPKSK